MKSHLELRTLFDEFWSSSPRNHVKIEAAPLTLANDATTLFTSSGMQPLVPFLAGAPHPQGTRLFNIQPSIRTQDIEEVGDNRHTTFFEMMGNWSLGDYFKEEQLQWKWEFLTKVLKLPADKLHITVFEGNDLVPRDEESAVIWKKMGVAEEHIHYYGVDKNWWSRSGPPDKMPEGEIGGPDSEVFYDFGTPHNPSFGPTCHPNCDCGRFMEFANTVFIQYRRIDNTLVELPQKNVDFGGGLERTLAIWNNNPDIFSIDIFQEIISQIESDTSRMYTDKEAQAPMRIIADHIRASVFLIIDGIRPSNKEHGYVLRRLLRRSAVKMYELTGKLSIQLYSPIVESVFRSYEKTSLINKANDPHDVTISIEEEMEKFSHTLDKGLTLLNKLPDINAKTAFNLYQSYGFPFELTVEIAAKKGIHLNKDDFDNEFLAHKELSKTTSAGKFKGGLADESEKVVKYHTATHLLHQALKDVFGDIIRQEGSNITQERLRFDTRLDHKPTDEEIKKVEDIINQKVDAALPVFARTMPREEAEKLGAAAFFKEKYGDSVQVYFIGGTENDPSSAYSKELCGGPHVHNTSEIGHIKITKVKKIGTQLVRIYVE